MAKAADSTPKRGKSTSKTASSTKTAAAAAKPRSRTTKRSTATKLSPAVAPALEQSFAQLMTRVDALEEKITASVSILHTQLQTMQAEWQSMKDRLEAMQHEAHEQTNRAANNGDSPEEPPETFLPVVADLIRRNLTEHLSPMTATLRRLEERIGFVSNRLKPASGGQDRQKQWRRDQRDPAHHPRSRGQGAARHGQGGQAWSPPSAASVQGHFAPRRYPGDLQIGDEEE